MIAAPVHPFVMIAHEGGGGPALGAQRQQRPLPVIGVQLHGIPLAGAECAGLHPGRYGNRQLTKIMRQTSMAHGRNVLSG